MKIKETVEKKSHCCEQIECVVNQRDELVHMLLCKWKKIIKNI